MSTKPFCCFSIRAARNQVPTESNSGTRGARKGVAKPERGIEQQMIQGRMSGPWRERRADERRASGGRPARSGRRVSGFVRRTCFACIHREIGAVASDKNDTSEDRNRIGRIASNSMTFQANRRQGSDWDAEAVARPDFKRPFSD